MIAEGTREAATIAGWPPSAIRAPSVEPSSSGALI
jgi:hypothetical protein